MVLTSTPSTSRNKNRSSSAPDSLTVLGSYSKITVTKMVALSEVVASNQRIAAAFPDGLVAVFVGATSGVGAYTVKAFAKYVRSPRVYIVGRSQDAGSRIVNECQEISPHGTFEFIRADVSLIKNVDDVCRIIKNKEETINLLFESQGSMAFSKSKASTTSIWPI